MRFLYCLNPSFSGISFRTYLASFAADVLEESLNPSFSGISFRTKDAMQLLRRKLSGLNPSFSGISFRTEMESTKVINFKVLILLLVEYPFGPGTKEIDQTTFTLS